MMNRIMHVSLNVNDLPQTKQFYTSTFPNILIEEHDASMILRFQAKQTGIEFIHSESNDEADTQGNVRLLP